SLVATNTVGASTPFTTTISVVGSPTAVATSTSICAPQNGVLTVNTNASFVTWQGGQTGNSAVYAPTVTTAYSYTAANGACQVTGTATITVGLPPPTPSFTQTGNVLTSSSALNYQWYLNGSPISGATSQNYTITTSGWYSVWTDNGTGCQASSASVYITITSLDGFSVFNAMEAGPNPAKDQLILVFKPDYNKEISGTIKNAAGQIVKAIKIRPVSGEKFKIDLEGIADGVYTLSLVSEGAAVNYKFVKQ
ncbi:MAG: T9SS type A sorting domain-containing protein, partial [Bacteroidia bacterium]